MWNNKSYRMLCVIEIIFALFEVIALHKPLRTVTYFPDQFQYQSGIPMENFPYSSHEGVYLDNSLMEEGQDHLDIGMPEMNLLPGSYHIILSYSASDGDNRITCLSENNWRSVWRLQDMALNAGEDVTHVLKIRSLLPIGKLSTTLSFCGNGYLYLTSIRVVETRELAVRMLYYGLILFIALNFFLLRWVHYTENQKKLLIALLFVSFLSSLPIFGMHLGTGDDLEYHLLRINALAEGLHDGQFPVRISSYWNNGYGYASSLFYNDAFLIFPAVLRLLGFSVQSAYKQYVVAINLMTVGVTWYSFRNMFQKRTALIGTALYMFLPFRLSDLYKRAAVGEYTAMVFFPLIVWGIFRIYCGEMGEDRGEDREQKNPARMKLSNNIRLIMPAVLGFSGLIASHVISTFLVGIITIIFCLVMIRKTIQPKILLRLLLTAFLVFFANAWYIVPMADSMRFGINATSEAINDHIQRSGTYIYQLFDLFPEAGGASYIADEEIYPINPGNKEMSFSAGVGIFGVIFWTGYRLTHKSQKNSNIVLGDLCCGLGILCLIMTTIWFPWDFLTRTYLSTRRIFGNIQFPWRILGVAGILTTITCMCLVTELEKPDCHPDGKRNIVIQCGFVCIALVSAMYFIHSYDTTVIWKDYTFDGSIPTTNLIGAEYLPANTDREIFNSGDPIPGEGVVVDNYQKKDGVISLDVYNNGEMTSYIDVSFLYYHGYVARYWANGQMLDGSRGEGGRTRVVIPAGYNGKITVRYRERILWRIADLVSVLAMMVLVIQQILYKRKFSS